jgi:hypothetical protein
MLVTGPQSTARIGLAIQNSRANAKTPSDHPQMTEEAFYRLALVFPAHHQVTNGRRCC